jgi:hypothetical protein
MLKTVSSITNAIGALNYKGTWNASTNTPTIVSGTGVKGDYYVVSVAGSTNIDGLSNWGVGDWIVFNGAVWQRVDGGADTEAVNIAYTGTLTGGTGVVNLGSGQFYKDASGNVMVGTTSTAGPGSSNTLANRFSIRNDALDTPQDAIKGGTSTPSGASGANVGGATLIRWIKSILLAGTRTKLIIPFISQGSLGQTSIVKVLVRQDEFNSRLTSRNFEVTFTVGHSNSLVNLASWGLGGNIASVTSSGMNVELNVTNTFTSGAVLTVYLEVMAYQIDRSVDFANIRVE